MFWSYHLWRFRLHHSQGNPIMAAQALWSDPDLFTITDAIILAALIAGIRAELEQRDGTVALHHPSSE